MVMLMVLIIMRSSLHDNVLMQSVLAVILALGRPRGPEAPSRQFPQPSETGDVVYRGQPA